jgi:5'-nucleotidase
VAPRPAGGVRIEPVSIAGLEGSDFDDLIALSVDGPPALAVLGARVGELGGPAAAASVVASGVNLGPNTGVLVLFSGTVGAALAAANLGLSALAVSIDSFEPAHLATATTVASAALEWVLAAPTGTVLNVNVPDLPVDRLAGFRQARLGKVGTVQAAVEERKAGPFTAKFRIEPPEPEPGTDGAFLRDGWVTLTALVGIRSDDGVDVASFLERTISASV